MRVRLLGCLAIAAGCLFVSSAAASANAGYPVVYNGLLGYGHALTPDLPAAGSHYVTWSGSAPAAPCTSASHRYPVVLVPGTWANQADDFAAVSPLLADNGYCVYTDNLGQTDYGDYMSQVGDIPTSASELATVVNKVLAATGATRVDLVGHSQGGGVLPRWYLKYDGGAAKVSVLVGLAPSNHGSTLDGVQTLLDDLGLVGAANTGLNAAGFPAAVQQEQGSQVNAELDQGGDTVPGVSYTTIVSRNDEVVTPYTNQFLTAGPGATVHNILLQDVCALDQGDHLSVVYDHIALRLMLNALDPASARAPVCSPVLPIQGG